MILTFHDPSFSEFWRTGHPVAALGFGAIPRSRGPGAPSTWQPGRMPMCPSRAMRLKQRCAWKTPSLETLPIYPSLVHGSSVVQRETKFLKKCAEQKHFIPLGSKKKIQSLLRNFGNWCFWWDRCFFQTLLTSLNKRLRSKGTWSPVKKQNKRQNLGISVLFFSRKNGFRRSVETAVDVQLLIYPKFHVRIQCRMIDTPKSWWYTESNRIIRYKDRI